VGAGGDGWRVRGAAGARAHAVMTLTGGQARDA
jgi:hypothetical protein